MADSVYMFKIMIQSRWIFAMPSLGIFCLIIAGLSFGFSSKNFNLNFKLEGAMFMKMMGFLVGGVLCGLDSSES